MSLIKVGVVLVVIGAFAAVPLIWEMQSVQKREQIAALLPEKIRPNSAVDMSTKKITVYQSQGHKGDVVFSDRQNFAHTARTRIVDNAKGTTTHAEVPKKEEKASSVLNFSAESERFQRQAQRIQQVRIAQAIGE
jgi:uncharacterized protein YxeA